MKRDFFTVVLLIVVVFATGIFVGSALRGADSSSVEKMLKQSELGAESFLVEQELFESFDTSCELAETRLATLSEDLWRLGKVLGRDDAKQQLGENYGYLKRKFHLMQVRIFILYKKLQANCGIETDVVLFYFKHDDTLSTEQGVILDALVEQHDLTVFAVEYNYSTDLNFLEEFYGVASTPFLIVNYDNKFPGLSSSEEIVAVLND